MKTPRMKTCEHLCKIIMIGCALALTAGCRSDATYIAQTNEINNLKQEKAELKDSVEQLQKDNDQLRERVQVLSDLPNDVKGENLYHLRSIKITSYTNLYDKDDNGVREKLIVYMQPIDQDGDIIKAAGSVDVELWDLNRQDGQAMLGRWHVDEQALRKLWFATILTTNYRLTFDAPEVLKKYDEPLTVKVAFADYLSGTVFTEQRVIKPN